ncbi:MAG TPA: metal-dependent phosphohydrolase, partial [Rhodoglobus sp.]|nr:metal-dependent phosphohydrolase [Rhodoglobus sp.]
PGGGVPELVLKHEKEGARIAREILHTVGLPAGDIERITEIIDGHDSRPNSMSLEDSIVKDADKLWRVTPHGRSVVCDWFGIDDDESLRLCAYRAYSELFTEPARAMSRALVAVGSMQNSSQLALVHQREQS